MSTQLEALGIALIEGYARRHICTPAPDLVVVGNAMTRGNPAVEHMLDARLPLHLRPAVAGREVLPGREVLAVAGTHGKTTTTSLLALDSRDAGRRRAS